MFEIPFRRRKKKSKKNEYYVDKAESFLMDRFFYFLAGPSELRRRRSADWFEFNDIKSVHKKFLFFSS